MSLLLCAHYCLDCSGAEEQCLGIMPNMMQILATSRNLSFAFKYEIPDNGFE
jgi:hypothetical protein